MTLTNGLTSVIYREFPSTQATAHALSEIFKRKGLVVTRLARGVPVGSELEFVDLGTIAHALVDRRST